MGRSGTQRGEAAGEGASVLIVESGPELARSVGEAFAAEGHRVSGVNSLTQARQLLRHFPAELVLLDLAAAAEGPAPFLGFLEAERLDPAVLVLVDYDRIPQAIEALREGAFDYLPKPFLLEVLLHRARNALSLRRASRWEALQGYGQALRARRPAAALPSPQFKALLAQAAELAQADGTAALVCGEPGVGKQWFCRLVHERSSRRRGPCQVLACEGFDPARLLDELFGSSRHLATGGGRRKGLLELTSQGTLIVKNVDTLPADGQEALADLLERGPEGRPGVRILATTRQNLADAAGRGAFSGSLWRSMSVHQIHIPPLRERPEDLRALVRHFCAESARAAAVPARPTREAMEALLAHGWPANLRELRAVIERGLLLAGSQGLGPEHLGLPVIAAPSRGGNGAAGGVAESPAPYGAPPGGAGELSLTRVEATHIARVLEGCGGNRTRAARALGIARSTLIRKIAEMGIEG